MSLFKMVFILQVFNLCGPEKESCVSNQTLRHTSCLVSCAGIYADIADDSLIRESLKPLKSLKQTTKAFEKDVMKGSVLVKVSFFCFDPNVSRFQRID